MFRRDCKFPLSNNFFLFGARGTGKSTLLRDRFGTNMLYVDLLNINTERELSRDPESLEAKIRAFQNNHPSDGPTVIVVDEVQKVPEIFRIVVTWA
jgi:uncharacterized protein